MPRPAPRTTASGESPPSWRPRSRPNGDRPAPMKLILFDIDGTLLSCGPQVRPLFASALEEVFGTTGDVDGYNFAGRTDPRIVIDLMTDGGFSPREALEGLPRVRDLYLARLERSLERHGMTLLPAVEELLGRLAARDDVLLALVTGNWEPGA